MKKQYQIVVAGAALFFGTSLFQPHLVSAQSMSAQHEKEVGIGGLGELMRERPVGLITVPPFDITPLQSRHQVKKGQILDGTALYAWSQKQGLLEEGEVRQLETFVFDRFGRFVDLKTLVEGSSPMHWTTYRWKGSYRIAGSTLELVWLNKDRKSYHFIARKNGLVIGDKFYERYANR